MTFKSQLASQTSLILHFRSTLPAYTFQKILLKVNLFKTLFKYAARPRSFSVHKTRTVLKAVNCYYYLQEELFFKIEIETIVHHFGH